MGTTNLDFCCPTMSHYNNTTSIMNSLLIKSHLQSLTTFLLRLERIDSQVIQLQKTIAKHHSSIRRINKTFIHCKTSPPPLDWDCSHTPNEERNVNNANAVKHVQDCWLWYSSNPQLSTVIDMYTIQGACNPIIATENTSALGYYPNCTYGNNDFGTGGVVAPSPTNE